MKKLHTSGLPPRLPPELTDRVIDCVDAQRSTSSPSLKDKKLMSTLKSCSLVRKSWLPRARNHIFRRLIIEPRIEETAILKSDDEENEDSCYDSHSLKDQIYSEAALEHRTTVTATDVANRNSRFRLSTAILPLVQTLVINAGYWGHGKDALRMAYNNTFFRCLPFTSLEALYI
ncbi:hypothetical protein D9758_017466 [Tetrapyrgos nigripes]|uniref:Uncharacterized protein n=1 Tax=Tetrapyrgos nigripes TaxID=182062 RepID=A0A8H5C2L6_9AGAR|nr:hypothetical protein D9758_017466 [Tetrapyrgos nigripes]